MFGRRRSREEDEHPFTEQDMRAQAGQPATAMPPDRPADRPYGPFDAREVDMRGQGHIDLGGLLIPGVQGMELRVEMAQEQIVAATVVLGQSAVQLQAFAAPKSEGIWADVRHEIAGGVSQQGGLADEVDGPLGRELRARVPVRRGDGSHGTQMLRFVGCDGPRWFLRGVISGEAAAHPELAGQLESLFCGVVVNRGDEPMAPRDPLPLRLPNQKTGQETPDTAQEPPFDPFRTGQRITEIR